MVKGWVRESARHALAARGYKTKQTKHGEGLKVGKFHIWVDDPLSNRSIYTIEGVTAGTLDLNKDITKQVMAAVKEQDIVPYRNYMQQIRRGKEKMDRLKKKYGARKLYAMLRNKDLEDIE